MLRRQKRLDEAKQFIDKAIELESRDAPYYVLQAKIVKEMGKDFTADEFLTIGLKHFQALEKQSSWELHWYQTAAEMRDDQETMELIRRERHNRKGDRGVVTDCKDDDVLPAMI